MAPQGISLPTPPPNRKLNQHGVNGVYYAGNWVDIEDCGKVGYNIKNSSGDQFVSKCASCPNKNTCAKNKKQSNIRSRSVLDASKDSMGITYDICIIGSGCVGSAIARELSKYQLSVLLLEAADDVSQGATKGNSGIVHAGYDDTPNTNRAKFCWKGNQMFEELDRELRFGYQKNGSLVIASNQSEVEILHGLMKRGETNGVQNLKILSKKELFEMEPAINPDAIAALYSPDAGNVIPYEYAIALAENAVDNGVELRIRREVSEIDKENGLFVLKVKHWEPQSYVESQKKNDGAGEPSTFKKLLHGLALVSTCVMIAFGAYMTLDDKIEAQARQQASLITLAMTVSGFLSLSSFVTKYIKSNPGEAIAKLPLEKIAEKCSNPIGSGGSKINVEDMFIGGSGSAKVVNGVVVEEEIVKATYVINCGGGASDKIARMIGDDSFQIKPRLGDYLLLNRNQGYLTCKTIFPCPDPVLGKGVLVQTTLWGNLILGPTARDTYKADARDMSDTSVQEYILSKCKKLCPYFDPRETIHAFCGARAKNSRGDWIIERSTKDGNFVHAAGIDSPGLAGSPAIALEIVRLLQEAGLEINLDPTFNPHRAAIITPKKGMRGLKIGPIGKNDSKGGTQLNDEDRMKTNVVCKCEKVTELEIVRAVRRSLPIDSTQAIRKRTRAGMGHCQGDVDNYNCECRVKAIIAREKRITVEETGGRPWPATSTLPSRWINDVDRNELLERMMK